MRILLLAGLLAACALPVAAHPELVQELQQCRAITSEADRLTCFDELAESTASASKTTTAKAPSEPAASADVKAPPAKPDEPDQPVQPSADFGLEQQQRQQLADRLTATVAKVDKNKRGKLIVTLDNGMVWQQTDDSYFRAKPDHSITIERGVLGVFYLGREGVNRRIKVERVK